VQSQDELMLISSTGTLVRTPVADISVVGRNTQGVRLIRLAEGERLTGVERVAALETAAEVAAAAEVASDSAAGGSVNTPLVPPAGAVGDAADAGEGGPDLGEPG
jgi:DNA gyrase subunit A